MAKFKISFTYLNLISLFLISIIKISIDFNQMNHKTLSAILRVESHSLSVGNE